MAEKELAKKEIQRLILAYEELKRAGRTDSFNEDETCRKFILPMFKALGWDVDGQQIIDEVTGQQIAGGQKRVDYAFNIAQSPVMYLEAKQLSADLYDERFAKQIINYGYQKSVTWGVLSDFEGIEVFHCKKKAKRLSEQTIIKLSYDEYLDKFDQLWLLSKESVVNGKLDEYARTKGHIINKVPVNELLLTKLLVWRNELIKDISSDNPSLNKDDVAECVQRLLNRLIFIRCCEDRNIDKPNLLRNLKKEWQNDPEKYLYKMLWVVFKDFNDGYDSGLFAEHLIDKIKISDKLLSNVISGLYEDTKEDVEFDFAVIDADVLGNIYEQYLGTIQKGDGVKDKEKRKSHGIYYTPKYIVDYIVKNTLGKALNELLDKKEYSKIGKLKVLDPACGSGSFLIKALELFDDAYGKTPEFAKFPKGRKIKTLCNNIYGVDLDSEAVELTRLNLLLSSTYSRKKLPKLNNNIECGNSLIDDPKVAGDKAFEWKKRFKEVIDNGGFDVIIGNPPYIKEYTNKSAFEGLHNSPYYQGKMDIWTLFACKAIDLLKDNGLLCLIAPNNWITNAGASVLRNKMITEGEILSFVDFGDFKVFKEAGIQTMIFVFHKIKPRPTYNVNYVKITDKHIREEDVASFLRSNHNSIPLGVLVLTAKLIPKKIVNANIVFANKTAGDLLSKIEMKRNFRLAENEVAQGIVAAPDEYFLVKDESLYNSEEKKFLKPFFTSTSRYLYLKSGISIIYLSDKNFGKLNIKNYPNINKHFEPYKIELEKAKIRYGTPNKPYYFLHREREEAFFKKGPKIVGSTRTLYPSFIYTENEYYGSRAMNFIKTNRIDLKYLVGLLNSRLICFWLKNKGKQLGDLLQIDKGPLLEIPLFVSNDSQQKRIINLVDKMLDLNQKYAEVKDKQTSEAERLKRKIDETDREIDDIVCKLYGLTEEEIGVVEGR